MPPLDAQLKKVVELQRKQKNSTNVKWLSLQSLGKHCTKEEYKEDVIYDWLIRNDSILAKIIDAKEEDLRPT